MPLDRSAVRLKKCLEKTTQQQFLLSMSQMVTLQEQADGGELLRLEDSVYNWQVKVHDRQLEILDEEERLLKLHVSIIKQQQAG